MATVAFTQPKTITAKSPNLQNLDLQDEQTRSSLMDALGIEKPKPKTGLFGRVTGLLDAFRMTDDVRQAQKEGFGSGVLDFFKDPLKKVGTAITGNDYSNKYDVQGGTEILKDLGVENKILKSAGGFLLDVIADPTTYITLGMGTGATVLTKGGAKTLTKAGSQLLKKSTSQFAKEFGQKGITEIAERLGKEGITTIAGRSVDDALKTLGKVGGVTTKELGEELAKKKLARFADKGVRVLKDLPINQSDEIVQKIMKEGLIDEGGFKFAGKTLFKPTGAQEKILKAYIDPISSAVSGAKKIPGIGGAVESLQKVGGETATNILGTVRKLFDRKYNLAGGDLERFGGLIKGTDQMSDRVAGQRDLVIENFTNQYRQLQNLIKDGDVTGDQVGASLAMILEDTPIEKLGQLPDDMQKQIFDLVEPLTSKGDIRQIAKEMGGLEDFIKTTSKGKLDDEIGRIVNTFDAAEAGQRIGVQNAEGGMDFMAQRSSFPDWVPEGYRVKKLFDGVSDAFKKNKIPRGKKSTELYNLVLEKAKGNVDLSDIDLEIKQLKNLKTAYNIPEGAETTILKLGRIKNPKLRNMSEEFLKNIEDGTAILDNVGALKGKSKANYIIREVLQTPSGKNLEDAKGLGSYIGGSMKSKLDPRNAVRQKQRFYEYLADLYNAGGVAKTTKGTGKQNVANLVDALAKGDLQVKAGQEFSAFAEQIKNGDILDGFGKKLYNTVEDVFDLELTNLKGYEKYIDEYMSTGKLAEPLKDKLSNLGYKQLKGKSGVIPAFGDAWFDEESHEVLSNIHKSFFGDESTNELVKMYDKVNRIFKTSQTVWFPAFHVRNLFSNVFGNSMAGVTNPKVYKNAIDVQKYANAVLEGNEEVIAKLGKIKVGDDTVADLYNLAKNNGVLGNNFYADLSKDLVKSPTKLGKINPLSKDFIVTEKMGKAGSMVEDNGRMALFIDRLDKGDDIRSAALKVKEVLFDYQDLTDFEKNVMRRFVPYYTWARKNAQLQMNYILKQPGKYSGMLKGFDEIKDAFSDLSDEEMETLPDWAKEGVGLVTGTGGTANVIKQFGLPHEAFQQLLDTNPLNQLSVPIKTGIELGTGQNIFKGKAIADDTNGKAYRNMPQFIKDRIGYKEEKRTTKDGKEYTVYSVDPTAKYWLGTFMGRSMSEATKASTIGATGDIPSDLMNIFTGVKRYPFDLTEEGEKRNREQAAELYDILLEMGLARKYTNTYIPSEDKKNILNKIGK